MSTHGWTEPDDGVDVRHVQPYEADKTYRCPGCDHEIGPGVGHEVVVPRERPDERRHWHSGCWHRAARQGERASSHPIHRASRPRKR
jgi:hypothetical protein